QHRAPCVVDPPDRRELETNEGFEVRNATPVEVDMMSESPRRERGQQQHERHRETHATAGACGPQASSNTGDGGSPGVQQWARETPARPLRNLRRSAEL